MAAEQAGSSSFGRSPGRAIGSPLLAVAVILAVGACGDDSDDGQGEPSGNASVATACDALEELAYTIQDISDSTSVAAIENQVQGPMAAFVGAAEVTGDEELSQLAETASTAFSDYLGGAGEAQLTFDTALDSAAARCLQLGAANNFPEEQG